jgi:VWFA-related protein
VESRRIATRSRRLGLATLVVVLTAAPALRAQQVFPSGVDLVAVDVTVVDRDGRPVADLRPGDFDVKVGGRPRTVVSAQLIRHVGGTPESAEETATPAAPGYSFNRDTPPGRLIVLAPDVGWMSTGGARAVTRAAGRFLARLAPEDRVALVTIPVGPRVDFTADHAKVAEALKQLHGEGRRAKGVRNVSLAEAFSRCSPTGDPSLWDTAVGRECPGGGADHRFCVEELESEARRFYEDARATTLTSLSALRQVFNALRTIDGPKVVLYVGQGLVTGRSAGEMRADRIVDPVAEDAARARVSLYTVLVDRAFMEAGDAEERFFPTTRSQDADLYLDGLETLAGYTGGPLLKAATTADFAFERVASETSATWLLSFEPEADDRDGKTHEIKVSVRRDGVEVRARPRFVVAPKEAAPASAAAHARRSLDALLPEADVPVTVTALALGQPEGGVRLVIAAQIGLGADLAATAAVGYRLVDAEGKVAAGAIETGRLERMRSAGGEALYYVATVPLSPGTYRLKLAAATPSGRTGSVERTVQAALKAVGSLRLSDLLVAEPGRRDSGPLVNVDGQLLARAVRVLLEVRSAAVEPTVRFELAAAGEPVARLTTDALVQPRAEPASYNADATLDLGSLEPGRYELRAVVLLPDGTEAGRVVRPLELLPNR